MSEIIDFELPDVGEGVAEGQLVQWHVAEGETIQEDQVVAEVETDKAVVEIPAPVDGEVRSLLAEAGETIPVGDVFITFRTGDEDEPEEDSAAEEPPENSSSTPTDAEPSDDDLAPTGVTSADESSPDRIVARPSVRRFAREEGVDLSDLAASTPGNRITERDVRSAAGEASRPGPPSRDGRAPGASSEAGDRTRTRSSDGSPSVTRDSGGDAASAVRARSSPSATTDADTAASERPDRARTLAAPATRRRARERGVDIDSVPADQTREGEAFVTPEALRGYVDADGESKSGGGEDPFVEDPERDETRVPYTGVRRAIGEQMERSKFTAPQVTHQDTVDASRLVETRERLKPKAKERGVNLTYLPFVMKACVAALKEYPVLNAELDTENDEIVEKHYYNFGVATDTEAGLMVPVVEDVDQKSVLEIAAEIDELVERARNRSITAAEMEGGTFTVTNLGGIGGKFGTPILNYPEVAILALGSLDERPWVVDGEVVPRHVLPISMTSDHRVVDGGDAARFTNELERYVESPSLLLLE